MDTALQDTLLQLFQQVTADPDRLPPMPIHGWQEGSQEWQLLTNFHQMLERLQQRMQEALKSEEVQYHGIFEASHDGIFMADLDGFPVEANPAACKMFGYSYEEFLGLDPTTLIHPDDLHLVREHVQATRAGKQYHSRGVVLRKDGTVFLADAYTTPFLYQGKPHLLVVVRDVTEQVQAEEQLREREAQYRSIFEATSDGLLINDLEDGHIVEANPAECRMHGRTYEELLNLPLLSFIHPDYHHLFQEYLETVKAGGQFQARAVDLRKDGTPYPVEVRGTPFIYKGKPHALSVIRDITEQVQAEEQLREKEAQYRSIFEASTDGLVINDLEDGHLVEVNPAMCRMHGYTYEEFLALSPMATLHPDSQQVLEESIQAINSTGEFHTQAVGLHKDGTPFHLESHAATFVYQGKLHMLSVVRDITEQLQAHQLLEQRVGERTRELSTLLEVSHDVASTLELKPLLGLVLDQLKVVADYTGSSFSIVEGEDLVLVDNRGPAPLEHVLQLHFPIKQMGLIWERFCRREPVIIADVHDDTPWAYAFREWMKDRMETTFSYIRGWMGVPLIRKERVIGMLTLSSRQPDYYTPRHARMAMAIANQAAVAIENARLYEQAQELAAVEERQRLARELHDSVSQALYGISLGAHTARTLLDRDPSRVAEALNYVLSLTEAALTEMRALIFELRPESLATEGLVTALTKQAAALQARYGIEVRTELCNEPDVPLKVKQELYRIAQEAMHNTVKHARAKKVDLRLSQSTEAVLLEVRDDGVGFDPRGSFPGHLGLHSMQERVSRVGGLLHIQSASGQGTSILAQIPGGS
jgi:PAS domain S-box-containing protein